MAYCTAPVQGHRSASAAANCPACSSRRRYSGSGYSSPSFHSYSSPYSSIANNSSGSSGGRSTRSSRARWSTPGSTVLYTLGELQALTPVREAVEKRAVLPELRDLFLCHAWDDRKDSAKDLYDLLQGLNVSVWFSEKDVPLGSSLIREIDKGLANSKVGIVLVTPAFLKRIQGESIADKELSALLFKNQLVPIVHNTTYEDLRNVSPLLASKNGLSTSEETMAEIAKKLAELVAV